MEIKKIKEDKKKSKKKNMLAATIMVAPIMMMGQNKPAPGKSTARFRHNGQSSTLYSSLALSS